MRTGPRSGLCMPLTLRCRVLVVAFTLAQDPPPTPHRPPGRQQAVDRRAGGRRTCRETTSRRRSAASSRSARGTRSPRRAPRRAASVPRANWLLARMEGDRRDERRPDDRRGPEGDGARRAADQGAGRALERPRHPEGHGREARDRRVGPLRLDAEERDGSGSDAPGANDDASGTAVVLACAAARSRGEKTAGDHRLRGGRRRGAGARRLGAAREEAPRRGQGGRVHDHERHRRRRDRIERPARAERCSDASAKACPRGPKGDSRPVRDRRRAATTTRRRARSRATSPRAGPLYVPGFEVAARVPPGPLPARRRPQAVQRSGPRRRSA